MLAEARGLRGDAGHVGEGELAEAVGLFERMGARYELERALGVRKRLQATVKQPVPS